MSTEQFDLSEWPISDKVEKIIEQRHWQDQWRSIPDKLDLDDIDV